MINTLKPTFRQLPFHTDCSLNVKVDCGEKLKNSWHYHPEMELILLKRSEGTRRIGDSIETFKHNDVFFIGKNLPHYFLHDEKYLINHDEPPEAIVVQFYENFLGKEFLSLPEFKEIQYLFAIAKYGACLTDESKKKIIPLMESMLDVSYPLDRMLLLLQILRIMVAENSYNLLVNQRYFYQLKAEDDRRINKILDFTSENYYRNIKIEELAEVINLTKESFCRYFKTQTGKSYLEFLIEYRISKACKLILKNEMSIKEIGYSCGFDSLSNFHYQFKKIIKQSPIEFRVSYSSKGSN